MIEKVTLFKNIKGCSFLLFTALQSPKILIDSIQIQPKEVSSSLVYIMAMALRQRGGFSSGVVKCMCMRINYATS